MVIGPVHSNIIQVRVEHIRYPLPCYLVAPMFYTQPRFHYITRLLCKSSLCVCVCVEARWAELCFQRSRSVNAPGNEIHTKASHLINVALVQTEGPLGVSTNSASTPADNLRSNNMVYYSALR